MFRFSLISLVFTLAFTATQAHSQANEHVIAVQQSQISSLKKQASDTVVKTDDLTKKITDQGKTIDKQAAEIIDLKNQISGLNNKIETTALTFTRIGPVPSTGTAACQAVGKECFMSYGGGDVPYNCSHNGPWKRVLCSAPF